MTRAAIYLRQSLDSKDDRLAISRQDKECQALCERRGWTVVSTFTDNDVSATRAAQRPQYRAMLQSWEARDFDAIVAWDLDRLYRKPRDLEDLIDMAEKRGLLLATVGGDADLSTDNGRLFARIKAAVAKGEGERKSARQKASSRQRVAMGKPWWSVAPFGYTKDGTLTQQADLVRSAYDQVLAGVTIAEITHTWNDAGALSPRGKRWIRTSVLAVLKAPRNAGLVTYLGEVARQGNWEPIVSEGTFYAVQGVLADPGRGKGGGARKHLLTGLAECGLCGRKMVSATQGAAKYRYRSYRCPTGHLSCKAEWLEAIVLDAQNAPKERREPGAAPAFRHHVTRPSLELLYGEASTLRERLDGITDSYAAGAIPLQMMTRGAADIERRLAEVQARMVVEVDKGQMTTGGTPWDEMTLDERARHLRSSVDVVVEAIPRYTKRPPTSVKVNVR
ncbi:MAG: recombinase family protein [Cellulomonas sp.]|uniref:recombinase family protein n=1 Tax=Cellulomonas sp. TaxID=40001 RepID=UPI0018009FA8|nr:recombinase family protein [Cellulomonas sp.]NMM29695.1 recombinase family protein [Cellulomonas sp.]